MVACFIYLVSSTELVLSSGHDNHLEGCLTHKLLSSIHKVPDSIGLGGGPRVLISDKFLGNEDAALGTTLGKPLV